MQNSVELHCFQNRIYLGLAGQGLTYVASKNECSDSVVECSRGPWFETHVRQFVIEQDYYLLLSAGPRKCPDMTEKLLTGM